MTDVDHKMTKPILITDLDGCVYDVISHICAFVRRYDLVLKPEWIDEWALGPFIEKAHGAPEDIERAKRGVIKAVQSSAEFYWTCPLYPGAQSAIARLGEHFTILAATSRPIGVRNETGLAVRRDFPEIHRVFHTRNKAQVAKSAGALWFLEDSPVQCGNLLRKKIQTVYVRRSYGRDVPVRRGRWRLHEVGSVTEAADLILGVR